MIDRARRTAAALLAVGTAWLVLAAGAGNAQTAAQEVGVVLSIQGEVLQEANSGVLALKEYSVLSESTTIRIPAGGSARLVHHREGVTYLVSGPAVVSVLASRLEVDPSNAIASRTARTPPVEQQARGGVTLRGERSDLRAGGENLDTSRSGLDAATARKGSPSSGTAEESNWGLWIASIVLACFAFLLAKQLKLLRYLVALLVLGILGGGAYFATRQPDSEGLMRARVAGSAKEREAAARAAIAKAEESVKKAKDSEAAKRAELDRAAAEKAAADRVAADKAGSQKAAVAKAPTPPASAPSAAPEAPKSKVTAGMGTAERLALKEEEAARKAAEARGALAKGETVSSGGERVASAAPPAGGEQVPGSPGGASLFEQARAAEAAGDYQKAVRLYVRAVRAGDYRAAKALGDIFAEGKAGVPKDYGESLKYYALAEKHGIATERATGRGR